MPETIKNDAEEGNASIPNGWDSVANMSLNEEQTEQDTGEKEADTISIAKQHRQIWDKIVDRYKENQNRYSELKKECQSLGININEYPDNEDEFSDTLRSEYEKYNEEFDTLESLESQYDRINDEVSERLADHVLKSVDGSKITELFGLDPRYKNTVYENYDGEIKSAERFLNDSEKFGLFCIENAKKPIGPFKGKTPKEIIEILEDYKEDCEIQNRIQASYVASVLQRVSYHNETNAKVTDWLDQNVPNHEKVEGEALLEVLNEEYDNKKSEEEIFSELF